MKADLSVLDKGISGSIASAWAPSTLRTRNSQWGKFLDFCMDNNLVPLPALETTVARFLYYMSQTCTYTTVNNYLSAIMVLHRFFGHEANYRESYYLKLLLTGINTMSPSGRGPKDCLTPSQLKTMYTNIDFSDINHHTMWACLMLGFRSLLRKSNLVPTSAQDLSHVLCRSDVYFTSDGLRLIVRSSKTRRLNQDDLIIPVAFTRQAPCFCAASMLATHISRSPRPSDQPLFHKIDKKGRWSPLLYSDLLGFIKGLAPFVQKKASDVGTHSLRRSGATFLSQIGVPLHEIRTVGDWKSLAVLAYLVTPIERKEQIDCYAASVLNSL